MQYDRVPHGLAAPAADLLVSPSDPDAVTAWLDACLAAGATGRLPASAAWAAVTGLKDGASWVRLAEGITRAGLPDVGARLLASILRHRPRVPGLWEDVAIKLERFARVPALYPVADDMRSHTPLNLPAWFLSLLGTRVSGDVGRVRDGAADLLRRMSVQTAPRPNLFAGLRVPSSQADLDDAALDGMLVDYADLTTRFSAHRGAPWYPNPQAILDECVWPVSRDQLRDFALHQIGQVGVWQGDWRAVPMTMHRELPTDAFFGGVSDRTWERHEFGSREQAAFRAYLAPATVAIAERYDLGDPTRLCELAALAAPAPAVPCYAAEFDLPFGVRLRTNPISLCMVERLYWIREQMAATAGGRPTTGLSVLEIGFGYGELAAKMLASGMAETVTLVDLPLNLLVARRFFETLYPGRVQIIASPGEAVSADASVRLVAPWCLAAHDEAFDMAVNFLSFCHMPESALAFYLDYIADHVNGFIVHENLRLPRNPEAKATDDYPFDARFHRAGRWMRSRRPNIVRELLVSGAAGG